MPVARVGVVMWIIFLVLLSLCLPSAARFWPEQWAREAYESGDHATAARIGREALVADHADPKLNYNDGYYLHQQGEHAQAAAAFERALYSDQLSEPEREQAMYNCANALAHAGDLRKSLAQYEAVLRDFPENEKAQHDIEIIKKLLEEREQREQDEGQQGDQEQREQNSADQQTGDQRDQGQQQADSKQNNDRQDQQADQQQGNDDDERQQTDGSHEQEGGEGQQRENGHGSHDTSPEKNESKQKQDNDSINDQFKKQERQNDRKQKGGEGEREQGNDQLERNAGSDVQDRTQHEGDSDKQQQGQEHAPASSVGNIERQSHSQDRKNKQREQLGEQLYALASDVQAYDARQQRAFIQAHVKQEKKNHAGQKNW